MRIPAFRLVQTVTRPLRSLLFPGGLIIGYHRVADVDWDPLHQAVSPEVFHSQVRHMSAKCEMISAGQMGEMLRDHRTTKHHVALTFDDCYEDLSDYVLPVLESFDVPATLFVTTGYPKRHFWWDDVSSLLDPRRAGGDRLSLDFGSSGSQKYKNLDDPATAAGVVRAICNDLMYVTPDLRARVIETIREQRGPMTNTSKESFGLEETSIRKLAESRLIEIGAHTVSHAVLTELDVEEQTREIRECRVFLEGVLKDGSVLGFSYPHGYYSDIAREIVRESGFTYACTSHQSHVRSETDCFQMPRVWPPANGSAGFRRWFASWVFR